MHKAAVLIALIKVALALLSPKILKVRAVHLASMQRPECWFADAEFLPIG